MAGTFDFGAETWDSSGGAFRAVVTGIIAHLPLNNISTRIIAVLKDSVDSNMMFVDFDRDLDPEMREAFKIALQLYFDRVAVDGADALENPALYEGYLDRIKALVEKIQRCQEPNQ